MTRRLQIYLPGLLLSVLWAVLPLPAAAQEAAAEEIGSCAAATPVMNPWTKGNPEGWWMKWHERLMAAPGRKEVQIAIIGDSITAGWHAAGEQFAPWKVLNLGVNCDSTQHALWRILNGEVDGMPKLKVVVVELGVNNKGINRHSDADIEKGIIAVCDALKQKAPQARIILMGVFPRYYGWHNSDELNLDLARLHDGKRIFFVNINRTLADTEGAIADHVGHLTGKGCEIWADSIRSTVENLMSENVRFQEPIGVVPEASSATRDGDDGGKGRSVKSCRATTPARSMKSPRWYFKHFGISVWGNKFERRRAALAFLGGTITHNIPRTVWDKEFAPFKTYNLGMPGDRTENVLWRIDNGAIDPAWSNLKLLVLEVGVDNKKDCQDKPEDIAAGFEAICNRVRANVPQAKILLMGLFPPFSVNEKHDNVNTLIAKVADGKHVYYLNINDALIETPDALGGDGTTLTGKGYEVWLEQMRPIVARLMEEE